MQRYPLKEMKLCEQVATRYVRANTLPHRFLGWANICLTIACSGAAFANSCMDVYERVFCLTCPGCVCLLVAGSSDDQQCV